MAGPEADDLTGLTALYEQERREKAEAVEARRVLEARLAEMENAK